MSEDMVAARTAPLAAPAGPERVVVVAASAGGIEALSTVISRLSAPLQAAMLIVQHLRPGRPTGLAEYLNRLTTLPVRMAEDGLAIKADTVYVAVPGYHLSLSDGRMALDEGERVHYVRPAADLLFRSAARDYGCGVIGVVLSGTGRDGAEGCVAIKENGGTTIVQDAATARCPAMPAAAIKRDAADHVLPIGDIAGQIQRLLSHPGERPLARMALGGQPNREIER